MQKRKAHNKSRRGCQNCKKRHVKCDEQGPPCAACVIRKTIDSCAYQSSPRLEIRYENITLPERGLQNKSERLAESKLSIVASFAPPPTASSSLGSHRLLELELMHRWTTRTWTAFYSIPGDQEFLQFDVPRAGLENGYLMNGMLAIAAVDLARSSKGSNKTKYICAALDYSNKACAEFRPQLLDINENNIHLLYLFGMIAAGFEFTLPLEPLGAINRMSNGFDLMLGAFDITLTNPVWFFESYSALRVLLSYKVAPMDLIDVGARVALEYLTSVSHQFRVPASLLRAKDERKHEDLFASDLLVYRTTIAHMKYCFAEDARALVKGYCLSLVSVAGRDFAFAFRRLEPMALFIMLYFGVLLDRVAQDPLAWWIASTGKDLVKEASEILQRSPIAQITDCQLGIYWTRQQVGLPMLVDSVAFDQIVELH